MIRFLAGLSLVYATLFAWSLSAESGPVSSGALDPAPLAAVMIGAPALSAWAAAELANVVRPVRLFDRRIRRGRIKLALGLLAGTLGALLGAGLLPLLDEYLPDAAILGSAAAVAASATVLLLPRRRPGHCIFCGYDLRDGPSPGQTGAGRCPECGAAAA